MPPPHRRRNKTLRKKKNRVSRRQRHRGGNPLEVMETAFNAWFAADVVSALTVARLLRDLEKKLKPLGVNTKTTQNIYSCLTTTGAIEGPPPENKLSDIAAVHPDLPARVNPACAAPSPALRANIEKCLTKFALTEPQKAAVRTWLAEKGRAAAAPRKQTAASVRRR